MYMYKMQGGSYRGGRGGLCPPNNWENYGGKKPVYQLITWDSTHLEFLIAL